MTDFQLATHVSHWLEKFERALAGHDEAALRELFHADSHWRDVLALTWRIQTVSGRDAIAAALKAASAHGFRVDPDRTAPRHATRAGEKCVEAIYRFETVQGVGAGVVRLRDEKAWRAAMPAWSLLTPASLRNTAASSCRPANCRRSCRRASR